MKKEYICVKDYIMDNGDIAFLKRKQYSAIYEGKWFSFFNDELGEAEHIVPPIDMEEHFRTSFKFGR